MNTEIGDEQKLVECGGIRLPALIDAGLTEDGPEQLDEQRLEELTSDQASAKYFGADSNIELRREINHPWYIRNFLLVTLSCVALVVITWLVTRILFVW